MTQHTKDYHSPSSAETGVDFEQDFLIGSSVLLMQVDILENMNLLEDMDQFDEDSDFYFEF